MSASPRVLAVRLNLPDVDAAFPEFLQSIDELQAAIARHREMDEIRPLLQTVISQSLSIFRREQEAMDLTRDRMALAHRTAHQKFLRSLSDAQNRLTLEGPSIGLSQDLRRNVVDWMHEHHLLMDAALGRHIKQVVERSLERISSTDVEP